MTSQTNSIHYRFAANSGVEYQASRMPPYGGLKVEIPVVLAGLQPGDSAEMQQSIQIDEITYAHLRMFALGAYQPLAGFMNAAEVNSVIGMQCLTDFLPWDEPVYITTNNEIASGTDVSLVYKEVEIAHLKVTDQSPTPDVLKGQQPSASAFVLGGTLTLILHTEDQRSADLADWNQLLDRATQDKSLSNRTAIVGAEPWLANDEYLIRSALVLSDQVLIHPASHRFGPQNKQLPENVVRDASALVLDKYYSGNRVISSPVLSCLVADEISLIHLSIVYQNLGCQRLVVVSDKRLQRQKELAAFDIDCIIMEPAFHCTECGGHATRKFCSHTEETRTSLSESQILNKLLAGEQLPPMVARPEVARMMSKALSKESAQAGQASNKRHIFPHASQITIAMRHQINGHRSAVLWMTGLSGSGKSTLATCLEKELVLSDYQVCVLDGDTLRNGLCGDLGFSPEGRKENLRRAAEMAKILMQNGMLVIASFISPFSAEREMLREIIGKGFFEVYIEASLEDCERRDPKGLYQRARSGLIPEFTGVSSPYEEPGNPDFRVNTSMLSLKDSVRHLLSELRGAGLLRQARTSPYFIESSTRITDSTFNPVRRS